MSGRFECFHASANFKSTTAMRRRFDNSCNATVGPSRAPTQPVDGTVKSNFQSNDFTLSTEFGLSDNDWFNWGAESQEGFTACFAAMTAKLGC